MTNRTEEEWETQNFCPLCDEPVNSESYDDGERVEFRCSSCDFSVTL